MPRDGRQAGFANCEAAIAAKLGPTSVQAESGCIVKRDADNRLVLTDDTKAFIRATIKSVWALELLLFIRGHEGRGWTAGELTRELRASPLIVERGLTTFIKAGLVSEEPGATVRYAPAAEHLRATVDAIADAYATQPLAVSNEIYAPEAKIQDFADAFKLRKD